LRGPLLVAGPAWSGDRDSKSIARTRRSKIRVDCRANKVIGSCRESQPGVRLAQSAARRHFGAPKRH
jgi:hypothetical protein